MPDNGNKQSSKSMMMMYVSSRKEDASLCALFAVVVLFFFTSLSFSCEDIIDVYAIMSRCVWLSLTDRLGGRYAQIRIRVMQQDC